MIWAQVWTFILSEEPDGPSTPFASGVLAYDVLRVIVLFCVAAICALAPLAVKKTGTLGQKARFLASTIVFVGVFGTELEHFGDFVHWRLYFNFIASTLMAWGYWSLFRYENPAELKPITGP
jgi:hypothetical protein